MKKNKKSELTSTITKVERLIISFIVIIAFMTIGLGTYAYFNVSKTSDINLTMISYDPEDPPIDPSGEFSIRLYEHDGANEVLSRTYTNVIPGSKLDKDPTIVNTGKYDMWVRVNVIFTKAHNWEEVSSRNSLVGPIGVLTGISNDWYYTNEGVVDNTNDTITYRFYYKNALSSNQSATVFNRVDIPLSFNDSDMQKISNFQIKVTADAIQKENTGDSCYEAFVNYWSID